jgi:single-strand DNA-binding protein
MNINILIVGGRLTRDPELKTGANGRPVCRSSMAINRKRKGGEDEVVFLDITCFDQLAESFHRFHRKGSTVLCTGRLYQHNWKDQDGKDRVRLTMVADSWEFCGDAYKRPQSTKPQDDQSVDF